MKPIISLFVLVLVASVPHNVCAGIAGNGRERRSLDWLDTLRDLSVIVKRQVSSALSSFTTETPKVVSSNSTEASSPAPTVSTTELNVNDLLSILDSSSAAVSTPSPVPTISNPIMTTSLSTTPTVSTTELNFDDLLSVLDLGSAAASTPPTVSISSTPELTTARSPPPTAASSDFNADELIDLIPS